MSIIYNALTGAIAAQAALNTTSQNIANVQTPGYSRQGVLLSAVAPGFGTNTAGNGVQVTSLIRFNNAYQNQNLWTAASALGAPTQSQPYLSQMEQVMSDDQSSISAGVDQFFTALNGAAVDPTSTPLRQQVITAAGAMSQNINSIYDVAANQLVSISQQEGAMMPQINQLTQSIATLNQQITQSGAAGSNISALLDQRDSQIDQLSSLVSVEVNNQPDGSVAISLKSGQPLVAGNVAASMSLSNSTSPPSMTLTFTKSQFALDPTQLGGELGGVADYAQNTLKPLQQSIADMAQQMTNAVNTQLAAGFDSNGNAGAPLLVYNASSTTSLLSVTPGITTDQLAFSADGTPGDSTNLQALIDIKNQPVNLTSIGSVLLGDADTQLVGQLGIDSQQNQALLTTATTVRQQAEDDKSTTSGVNSDEEASNLVQYQNMYQANMKVISVANTLFDATLAMFNPTT
jgi:flagellar hook-associated protein 1 FlgK